MNKYLYFFIHGVLLIICLGFMFSRIPRFFAFGVVGLFIFGRELYTGNYKKYMN